MFRTALGSALCAAIADGHEHCEHCEFQWMAILPHIHKKLEHNKCEARDETGNIEGLCYAEYEVVHQCARVPITAFTFGEAIGRIEDLAVECYSCKQLMHSCIYLTDSSVVAPRQCRLCDLHAYVCQKCLHLVSPRPGLRQELCWGCFPAVRPVLIVNLSSTVDTVNNSLIMNAHLLSGRKLHEAALRLCTLLEADMLKFLVHTVTVLLALQDGNRLAKDGNWYSYTGFQAYYPSGLAEVEWQTAAARTFRFSFTVQDCVALNIPFDELVMSCPSQLIPSRHFAEVTCRLVLRACLRVTFSDILQSLQL